MKEVKFELIRNMIVTIDKQMDNFSKKRGRIKK